MSKARIVDSKMIVIEGRGRVTTSRGLTTTPITSPYREKCSVIWSLLTKDKAKVAEVLSDGTKCYLSVQNFNTDNEAYVKMQKDKAENERNKAVSAPTGLTEDFRAPQSATEKASEKFSNNSVFNHETASSSVPEMQAEAAVPAQNAGGPQNNWGGKKKNKHNNQKFNNYTSQQQNNESNRDDGNDQSPKQPIKDMAVGMESL